MEVTSPLQDPTAIIPHASAVTPTTWGLNRHARRIKTKPKKGRMAAEGSTKPASIPPRWTWSLPSREEEAKEHLLCWSQRRPGRVCKQEDKGPLRKWHSTDTRKDSGVTHHKKRVKRLQGNIQDGSHQKSETPYPCKCALIFNLIYPKMAPILMMLLL